MRPCFWMWFLMVLKWVYRDSELGAHIYYGTMASTLDSMSLVFEVWYLVQQYSVGLSDWVCMCRAHGLPHQDVRQCRSFSKGK